MRLFIAINFDEPTIQHFIAVQDRLRALGSGKFSWSENLHLTLAFLGEIAPALLPTVREAIDNTVIHPLTLTFDHVGCFKRDGGDIWWIGLQENMLLLSLQKELSGQLAGAGFSVESRRFSPHITLAREVRLHDRHPDRSVLLGHPFTAQVGAVSLIRSERIEDRLTYTELYRKGVSWRGDSTDRPK